ncbi:MAG: DUF4271 domain-containing protein [Candidatus Pseudobacter hemicellulosilyticus]|uniref:DUF4271 domain-containing protein n=1 Tax=Candidatus Pseudobacter hemicellulosilyticus TaxID=3121375 RepID=A0AAJ5WSX7_9BACT|nr:MAG: DUF4271 domain-containing protein [Pseudobacter sp.]
MKKILSLFCCLLFIHGLVLAQAGADTTHRNRDTAPARPAVSAVQDTPRRAPAVRRDTGQRTQPVAPPRTAPARPVTDSTLRGTGQPGADSLLQQRDSLATDSSRQLVDTPVVRVASQALIKATREFQAALREHPYYNFFGRPIIMPMQIRQPEDQDTLFYFLAGLVFFFGLIKVLFSKYVDNIMTLFFRVTMRQQQLRDQMLQTPVASILLNLLYFLAGGLFLAFIARYYNLAPEGNLWLLAGACSGVLLIIYLGKYLLLKIMGWIFNVRAATDTYIFIVFLVNKMIGIALLPILVMLAFPYPGFYAVIVTLAFIMLAIFLGYRCIISYKPIRNEIKVSRFHFFLYLCAFEIAPLLLIYKVLLIFVERSY